MFEFDADLKTVDTGVWAEWGGSKFLIAHISNMKFQRALARLQQPHRSKIERGTLDPKTNRDILAKAMAEGVLLGWRDVCNSKKEPTEYSLENAFTALTKSVEFRDFVAEFAGNLMNYREEQLEDLGNS
jgi:hypothetical protein